jgi:hypothetical protein
MTGTDFIGSSKSNYNTITTTTAPVYIYDYETMQSYINDKGLPILCVIGG